MVLTRRIISDLRSKPSPCPSVVGPVFLKVKFCVGVCAHLCNISLTCRQTRTNLNVFSSGCQLQRLLQGTLRRELGNKIETKVEQVSRSSRVVQEIIVCLAKVNAENILNDHLYMYTYFQCVYVAMCCECVSSLHCSLTGSLQVNYFVSSAVTCVTAHHLLFKFEIFETQFH